MSLEIPKMANLQAANQGEVIYQLQRRQEEILAHVQDQRGEEVILYSFG